MSKRQVGPALYEKMQSRAALRTPSPEPEYEPDVVGSGDRVPVWLQPGHTIRVPMGYVFVTIAAVLVIMTVAYMVGHQRGEGVARAEADRLLLEHDSGPVGQPLDPLAVPKAAGTNESGAKTTPDRQPTQPAKTSGGSVRWGAITSDPRQSGLNYFVLSETNPDGAERVAEFCREKGLETYVVAGNTAKLRKVIALPGFESSQRSSAAVKALEDVIHRIGDEWQAKERGARNFRDAYPALYGG